jgi:subtilase family serine protease
VILAIVGVLLIVAIAIVVVLVAGGGNGAGGDGDLPDLVIRGALIELESGGRCDYASTQLGVRVVIENAGAADAGPFDVEVNGVGQTVAGGLAAGESISLWFPGYESMGENEIIVDVLGDVKEGGEGNNTFIQRLPVPTLPPTCTPSS